MVVGKLVKALRDTELKLSVGNVRLVAGRTQFLYMEADDFEVFVNNGAIELVLQRPEEDTAKPVEEVKSQMEPRARGARGRFVKASLRPKDEKIRDTAMVSN